MCVDDRELRAAERVVAGRALLRRTAIALRPHGVIPAVLKGALISALTEGQGVAPRPMIDVDVLLAPHDREIGERALADAGLEPIARTTTATTFRDHDLGMDLDLHAHLVEPGLFALDTDEVLSRAEIDRDLFGHEVLLLHPHDTYAHLIAHFARQRGSARDRRRLGDFARISSAYELEAPELARALEARGVGRAARYVLRLAGRQGDAFADEVLASLPRDVIGEALSRAAELWLLRYEGSSLLAIPALHLLDRSLGAGSRSFVRHLLAGGRSRARGMLEGALKRR